MWAEGVGPASQLFVRGYVCTPSYSALCYPLDPVGGTHVHEGMGRPSNENSPVLDIWSISQLHESGVLVSAPVHPHTLGGGGGGGLLGSYQPPSKV